MNTDYLDDYDLNTNLQFEIIDSESPIQKMRKIYDLIEEYISLNREDFIEQLLDNLHSYYVIYTQKILYAYAMVAGSRNLYILEIMKDRHDADYLLLDFIIYSNIQRMEKYKLIINDADYTKWLPQDNKENKKHKLEWGNVTSPNMANRIDKDMSNLAYKIYQDETKWEQIFKTVSPKNRSSSSISPKNRTSSPKNKSKPTRKLITPLVSPPYEKYVTKNFPHIKFESDLVCKKGMENDLSYRNIKEILFYSNFDHPNIPTPSKIVNAEFCLPRYDKLKVKGNDIKDFLFQLLKTLNYIHALGVIHSDIKPINILQDKNKKYYLIDFGLAQFLAFSERLRNYNCTYGYAIEHIEKNNNTRVDLFSLAMTVIHLLTGHPGSYYNDKNQSTYESSEDVIIILNYLKSKIVENIGVDGYNLLYSMLGLNGEYISAQEALDSIYFDHHVSNYSYEADYFDIYDDNYYGNMKIYTNVDLNTNYVNTRFYNILIEYLAEVTENYQYNYMTYIFTIHIFRQLLAKNLVKVSSQIQLFGICCFIIATIINEDEFFCIENALYITDNAYIDEEIEKCIYFILKSLNNKIELIPFNYFIDTNKKDQILFCFMFTYPNYTNYTTLEELSNYCVNTDINTLFKNWIYDEDKTVMQNVDQLTDLVKEGKI